MLRLLLMLSLSISILCHINYVPNADIYCIRLFFVLRCKAIGTNLILVLNSNKFAHIALIAPNFKCLGYLFLIIMAYLIILTKYACENFYFIYVTRLASYLSTNFSASALFGCPTPILA